MQPRTLAMIVSFVALAADGPAAAESFDLDKDTVVGEPIQHRNLTVFPVFAKAADAARSYMVLDEGLAKKVVKVREKGRGDGEAEVNLVVVENRGQEPLFLMSGEVILGGKQDRIVGKDTVVEPKQTVEVPVFCVEQGRWQRRAPGGFESGGALAHTRLRVTANHGSDQSKVWKEVAEKNDKRKVASSTGTYRGVVKEKSVADAVAGYQSAIGGALESLSAADRARLIGVVVALNGEVVAMEVFANAALFGKMRDKILRSYYVQAVDEPTVAGKKAPAKAAIVDFAADEADAEAAVVIDGRGYATEQKKGKRKAGSTVRTKPTAADKPAERVYQGKHAL